MEEQTAKLINYLVKYHFIDNDNAVLMVEDEFSFIEESFYENLEIKTIAKALIDIYMVA
jgi:hypothetical protein